MTQWQPIASAPKDGTPFLARTEHPVRWRAYKPNSQQFRSGLKGRWQKMNSYGGWDNADELACEWREWPVEKPALPASPVTYHCNDCDFTTDDPDIRICPHDRGGVGI
jgi:hypothetical protein